MVLEWTPEEASLLQDQPFSAAASVYISREAWEAQKHQTFPASVTLGPGDRRLCMRLVLVSFTLLYSCIIIPLYETLHDRPFLKRDSEPPDILLGTQVPRDRVLHEFWVYQTCACVIHINLIHCQLLVLSILHNVCAGYMCSVKL